MGRHMIVLDDDKVTNLAMLGLKVTQMGTFLGCSEWVIYQRYKKAVDEGRNRRQLYLGMLADDVTKKKTKKIN